MSIETQKPPQVQEAAQSQRKLTGDDIIRMIEENGGPEGLDLSNTDLSGIDLSSSRISRDLQETLMHQQKGPLPVWATEVIKTSPSGAAFWRLELGTGNDRSISPQDVSRLLRYGVNLRGVCLSGANLKGANLQRADLTGADLVQADLEGADLWACVLDNANLWHANLKNAYLARVSLQETILSSAILEDATLAYSDLRRADLYGANLKNATLYVADLEEANLSGTHLAKTSLWRAKLQDTRIDVANIGNCLLQEDARAFREHLGHHLRPSYDKQTATSKIDTAFKRRFGEARDVYLALKANFSNAGNSVAASWAHIKARQMEKQTHHPKRARFYHGNEFPKQISALSLRWWWFYTKHITKWLVDWAEELSCGYGERPLRVVACAIIILLLFPFLYQFSGGVVDTSGQSLRWIDYFHYSLAAFSTIGFPNLVPVDDAAKLLTSLEALLGIASLALLMFALGNRISRA